MFGRDTMPDIRSLQARFLDIAAPLREVPAVTLDEFDFTKSPQISRAKICLIAFQCVTWHVHLRRIIEIGTGDPLLCRGSHCRCQDRFRPPGNLPEFARRDCFAVLHFQEKQRLWTFPLTRVTFDAVVVNPQTG